MSARQDAVAAAYDAIAAEYRSQLADNPVAAYMRQELHRRLARSFHPGDRVLDFTAGTGDDAIFLAARGVQVTALDASAGMIAQLERAAARAQLDIQTRVLRAEQLGEFAGQEFDGALSTFAGLNTIDDLPALARTLAACLRPCGRVILHGLNRFCLWEWFQHPFAPARQTRSLTVGAMALQHRFYDPFALWGTAFHPAFALREVQGQSVIASPALARRFPRALRLLFALDRAAGKLWPSAGDFFLMELVRRGA